MSSYGGSASIYTRKLPRFVSVHFEFENQICIETTNVPQTCGLSVSTSGEYKIYFQQIHTIMFNLQLF